MYNQIYYFVNVYVVRYILTVVTSSPVGSVSPVHGQAGEESNGSVQQSILELSPGDEVSVSILILIILK